MKTKSTSKGDDNTQSTINQMFSKDLSEDVCQQAALCFYTSIIPSNCIKNHEFIKRRETLGRFGQGFKSPSYDEIREKYLDLELKNIEVILGTFKREWMTTSCSIMSDG